MRVGADGAPEFLHTLGQGNLFGGLRQLRADGDHPLHAGGFGAREQIGPFGLGKIVEMAM